ncbi:MAG: hypothetical protein FWH03_00995 [Firmicutes bacterium]|nr:hypothetical protein [Bacillota bacterium]
MSYEDNIAFVVDLDDTLIYTHSLNSDAYNYALERLGYPRINSSNRITKSNIATLYPNNINKIIRQKQAYFVESWMPYRTTLNRKLLKAISAKGKNNCLLWTSADRKRAIKIISHYGLNEYFCKILFDKKDNIVESIKRIKQYTSAQYAVLIDDRKEIAKPFEADCIEVGRLKSEKFNVGTWLIRLK